MECLERASMMHTNYEDNISCVTKQFNRVSISRINVIINGLSDYHSLKIGFRTMY
jgi:hypothetical protein